MARAQKKESEGAKASHPEAPTPGETPQPEAGGSGDAQKFQQATSLKVNLPLMELEAAREDMEEFLQSCLHKIRSQTESQELIEELSRKLSAHANRVRELIQVPKLADIEVSQ